MISILEILLYLQLITPSGTYTVDSINAIVNSNQQAIQTVQSDSVLMNQVDKQYNTDAQGIAHIDLDEGL